MKVRACRASSALVPACRNPCAPMVNARTLSPGSSLSEKMTMGSPSALNILICFRWLVSATDAPPTLYMIMRYGRLGQTDFASLGDETASMRQRSPLNRRSRMAARPRLLSGRGSTISTLASLDDPDIRDSVPFRLQVLRHRHAQHARANSPPAITQRLPHCCMGNWSLAGPTQWAEGLKARDLSQPKQHTGSDVNLM